MWLVTYLMNEKTREQQHETTIKKSLILNPGPRYGGHTTNYVDIAEQNTAEWDTPQ
jgi:hypothetical protein